MKAPAPTKTALSPKIQGTAPSPEADACDDTAWLEGSAEAAPGMFGSASPDVAGEPLGAPDAGLLATDDAPGLAVDWPGAADAFAAHDGAADGSFVGGRRTSSADFTSPASQSDLSVNPVTRVHVLSFTRTMACAY